MASYGRQAKSGFIWGMLARSVSTVVTIAVSIVVARILTPHDFGIAAIVTFFISISQRFTNFGFNTALIRLPDLRPDHSSTVFVVNVGLGVALGSALALAAPWIGAFYHSPEAARAIPIAGLTFAVAAPGTVPSALLARQLRFKALATIDAIYGSLVPISSLVLAYLGFGYWSLVHALLIGAIWDAVAKLITARWRPDLRVSRAALHELLSFGAGLHLKRLLDSVALNIDNMMIGRTLGLSALGIYDKAFTSMNRFASMISTAGQSVSLSVLGRMQDDPERFRQAFRRITVGIAIVGYPAFVGAGVAAKPLFLVLFGPQWVDAVVPFQLLCATGMLKTYMAYVSSAVQAKGRVWGEVWRQALYISLILGGVIIGSAWGLVGASIGVLAATVVIMLLMCHLLCAVSSVTWGDLIRPQAAGFTCGIVVALAVLLSRLAHDYAWPSLGVGGGLLIECMAGAVAAGLFLLTCPFEDGRRLVRETLNDFAPWVGRKLGLVTA